MEETHHWNGMHQLGLLDQHSHHHQQHHQYNQQQQQYLASLSSSPSTAFSAYPETPPPPPPFPHLEQTDPFNHLRVPSPNLAGGDASALAGSVAPPFASTQQPLPLFDDGDAFPVNLVRTPPLPDHSQSLPLTIAENLPSAPTYHPPPPVAYNDYLHQTSANWTQYLSDPISPALPTPTPAFPGELMPRIHDPAWLTPTSASFGTATMPLLSPNSASKIAISSIVNPRNEAPDPRHDLRGYDHYGTDNSEQRPTSGFTDRTLPCPDPPYYNHSSSSTGPLAILEKHVPDYHLFKPIFHGNANSSTHQVEQYTSPHNEPGNFYRSLRHGQHGHANKYQSQHPNQDPYYYGAAPRATVDTHHLRHTFPPIPAPTPSPVTSSTASTSYSHRTERPAPPPRSVSLKSYSYAYKKSPPPPRAIVPSQGRGAQEDHDMDDALPSVPPVPSQDQFLGVATDDESDVDMTEGTEGNETIKADETVMYAASKTQGGKTIPQTTVNGTFYTDELLQAAPRALARSNMDLLAAAASETGHLSQYDDAERFQSESTLSPPPTSRRSSNGSTGPSKVTALPPPPRQTHMSTFYPESDTQVFQVHAGMIVEGWTFTDSSDVQGDYDIRICHICKTDRPGANTWRRSLDEKHIMCNKCGIFQRTHHRDRTVRPDDHRAEFTLAELRRRQPGQQKAEGAAAAAAAAAIAAQSKGKAKGKGKWKKSKAAGGKTGGAAVHSHSHSVKAKVVVKPKALVAKSLSRAKNKKTQKINHRRVTSIASVSTVSSGSGSFPTSATRRRNKDDEDYRP